MSERSLPLDGRLALVLAAERLFAEFGVHGVSLRQIVEASGLRNASAVQYHFGSRDRLAEAVFEHRMSAINPRRQARLDAAAAAGRLDDMRALVSVWVWPLAEELAPRREGNYYVQFLAHATRDRRLAIELSRTDLVAAWVETGRHMNRLLNFLPPVIAATRQIVAGRQCVNSLAAFEADGLGGDPDFALNIENLIDMITGGLLAPVSAATLHTRAAMQPE